MSSSTPRKRRLKPKLTSPSPTARLEPPQSLLPTREELVKLFVVLAIASSVAVSCNFFADLFFPRSKPFCDSDLESLDSFSDSCEPCPTHGECRQGTLECIRGYRKYGRSCIEDGEINEMARKLSEWVENHLCETYVRLLCDGTGTAWVPVEAIWNGIDEHPLMKNFGWDTAIFILTKQKAMEAVGYIVEKRTNSTGVKELKCPDSLADHFKPYRCRIRLWISEHVLLVVPVSLLLMGSAILIWKVRRRWHLSARVEELYHQVCEILEENALMSKRGNGETEPWVVAARLRDHLLLPKERKDLILWKKVEELVQEDSRVDRYPKLVKGESKVVWEWQVEGSLSSSRKRGELSKLKSSRGVDASFVQPPHESSGSKLFS